MAERRKYSGGAHRCHFPALEKLFTFHFSPFTFHFLFFAFHVSRFTSFHYSLFTFHFSLFPPAAVEASVADRFADVCHADVFLDGQIGNGTGHEQDTVISAG